MKKIKYFLQFMIIIFMFLIFKLLGHKIASLFSGYIFKLLGPNFRSNQLCKKNLLRAIPTLNKYNQNMIINNMWSNYGKILSEYVFIKNYRYDINFKNKIKIKNQKTLEKIINEKKPVVFISGHFNNFELLAMHLETSGVNLAVIYRPLNNIFLNPLMEKIRKKYICKNQIKKGISGTKQLLKHFKSKNSIALMIDQRVSEGAKVKFFNEEAFTTTIPAQFVKKFYTKIVPIYIERLKNNNFEITIHNPLKFEKKDTIKDITLSLNKELEKMILKAPDQWIWTHNRWK